MTESNAILIDAGSLPPALQSIAEQEWGRILASAARHKVAGVGALAHTPGLAKVLATSPFVTGAFCQKPDLLVDLANSGDLECCYEAGDIQARLAAKLPGDGGLQAVLKPLRDLRQREMVRIVWRDFTRVADTIETTADVSRLAEACIRCPLPLLQRELAAEWGTPSPCESGEAQELIVIAMGKLGARELNVSSDIDLIFTYPETGETLGDGRTTSNQEFFIKLGQRLIAALDKTTVDGFVFRVDMRLRPYGDSGALVLNMAALEEYYQSQGRDWERYALIKARALTGGAKAVSELKQILRPFVYRRYIDFGAIAALRSMKGMITAEVRRRNLQQDIKLGPGGIREVEFIAQCFQLIRGGQDAALRGQSLLATLAACAELELLPQDAADDLRASYLFLRDCEHAIQGYADRQSQALPTDPKEQTAMVWVMGFTDWDAFTSALDAHRQRVQAHFGEVISAPEEGDEAAGDRLELWPRTMEVLDLVAAGFTDGATVSALLCDFRDSSRLRALQGEGRERLDAFMPLLLEACLDTDNPDAVLQRILPLVNTVLRRSAYLVLLLENPGALTQLVSLCAASPWISAELTRNPALLDELLDPRTLYSAPERERVQSELTQQVARVPRDDEEAQLEVLRYFKASQTLRVAACEISGQLPLMKVSDNLTFLAEVILEYVIELAWEAMVRRYGEPRLSLPDDRCLAVVAYGKLGGLELGYGSDLDLVFVFDADPQGTTNGERPIDNTLFYTRVGQRAIHILTTRTAMGELYEIDMRLRPSGASGMLVTTLKGYRDYLEDQAWTWEHQALVRARPVVGSARLMREIESLRAEILATPRDAARLRDEVVQMRTRMREHKLSDNPVESDHFHLKHGCGGIVDIEFMVQYAALAWSRQYPSLSRWTDNIRILETLGEEGVFTLEESAALTQAYIVYRSRAHEMALQQLDAVVESAELVDDIAAVRRKWTELMGEAL